jgi:hypothetical protein
MFLNFVLNDNWSKVFNILYELKKTKIYPCKTNNDHDDEIKEHYVMILNNIFEIV